MSQDRISVQIGGRTQAVDLEIVEYQPYEPSAYCWCPGWVCVDGETEYFVDETGQVWVQPANHVVGTAPEIVKQCEAMEKALDEAYAYTDESGTYVRGTSDEENSND